MMVSASPAHKFARKLIIVSLAVGSCLSSIHSQAEQKNERLDFANGLYARKMYDTAIDEYKHFLDSSSSDHPEKASAVYRLADCYFLNKDYKNATQYFEYFIKDYPKDERHNLARFKTALSFYHQSQYQDALNIFEALDSLSILDEQLKSAIMYHRGLCLLLLKQNERAIEHLSSCAQKFPESIYAHYSRIKQAQALVGMNRNPEAMSVYRSILKSNASDDIKTTAYKNAGYLALLMNEYALASEYLQQVLKVSWDEEVLENLYFCWEKLSEGQKALDFYLERKNDIDFGSAEPMISARIGSAFLESKQDQRAMEYLDLAYAHPKADQKVKLLALHKKRDGYAAKKEFEKALSENNQIIELSPDEAMGHAKQAELLSLMGKKEEAVESYKKATTLENVSGYAAVAHYKLALLLQELGRQEAALEFFKSFSASYPTDKNAPKAIAESMRILAALERLDEAVVLAQEYIDASSLSPEHLAPVYGQLGLLYAQKENFDKARTSFEKVLSLSPSQALQETSFSALSVIHEKLSQFNESIDYLEKSIALQNDRLVDPKVIQRLGGLYLKTNQSEKAALLYEKNLIASSRWIDFDSAKWLYWYLAHQGQYQRLKSISERMPVVYPNENTELYQKYFNALNLWNKKEYEPALKQYEEVAQMDQRGEFGARSYFGMGIIYTAMKQYPKSIDMFTKAASYDEFSQISAGARYEIGRTFLSMNKPFDAAKAFMMVAVLYEDNHWVPQSLEMAALAYRKAGKASDSKAALDELERRYPGYKVGMSGKAQI